MRLHDAPKIPHQNPQAVQPLDEESFLAELNSIEIPCINGVGNDQSNLLSEGNSSYPNNGDLLPQTTTLPDEYTLSPSILL